MAEETALLNEPGDWATLASDWAGYTDPTFFGRLHSEVAKVTSGEVNPPRWDEYRAALDRWSLVDESLLNTSGTTDLRPAASLCVRVQTRPDKRTCIEILRTALECAELASRELSDMDNAFRALSSGRPATLEDYEIWWWSCVHWLKNSTGLAEIPVEVWCALCDDETSAKKTAYLAKLTISIVPGGIRRLARHPLDAFAPPLDRVFRESMKQAWGAAKRLVAGAGILQQGARWHLVRDDDGEAVSTPTGASASAAAFFAYYFALQNKIPDAGIIIMARVSETEPRELDGVGEIDEKVSAVVRRNENQTVPWELIDTIVVATEENREQAEDVLRLKYGSSPPIRVIIPEKEGVRGLTA